MEEHEVLEFPDAPGAPPGTTATVHSHTISCFNASATLCAFFLSSVTISFAQPGLYPTAMILSSIVQCIYAIRPEQTRTSQFHALEETLDNWMLGLPEQLRYDPTAARFTNAARPLPAPNVLTMHMKYWCTVILLHRPFIKHLSSAKG